MIPSFSYLNSIYPTVKNYVRKSKRGILIVINIYGLLFWSAFVLMVLALVSSYYHFSIFNINFVAIVDIIVFIIGVFDKVFIKLISDARVRNAVTTKKGVNND